MVSWQNFWWKINGLEIISPESVTLIRSEILRNVPEPLAKLWILQVKLYYKQTSVTLKREILLWAWALRLGLLTSTSRIFNSCAWLLLFEVLREIFSLCLISWRVSCTKLSVDSVIVNYPSWKCLIVPENSSDNKSTMI